MIVRRRREEVVLSNHRVVALISACICRGAVVLELLHFFDLSLQFFNLLLLLSNSFFSVDKLLLFFKELFLLFLDVICLLLDTGKVFLETNLSQLDADVWQVQQVLHVWSHAWLNVQHPPNRSHEFLGVTVWDAFELSRLNFKSQGELVFSSKRW